MSKRNTNSSSPGRPVLVIACAFPPTGGSGVQRTAKFVKYLPSSGWSPIVWARDAVPGMPRDERLAAEVPAGIDVFRTGGNLWDGLWERARRTAERGGVLAPFARRIDFRLSRSLPRDRLPDDQIAWARQSVRPLEHLIRTRQVRALYSTFSPASDHWLALELKRRTGAPWVADFRDLWTDDYRYSESTPHRRAAHRELEQDVLENADAVIGVSQRQTEILASHVPSRRDRFVTITNGYDPSDLKGVAKAIAHEKESSGRAGVFVLAHVGRLDRWRSCEPLFDALADFVRSLGDKRKSFRVHLVGHSDVAARERFLTDGVPYRNAGTVDHADAIRAMASADALLLASPDGPNAHSVIPAKTFEYLASGRPILSVGPEDGEAERIVRTCQGGVTAGFDRNEILAGLCALYDEWRDGVQPLPIRKQALVPFQRQVQASRLARVLDAVADGNLDRLRELAVDPVYETTERPKSNSRRRRQRRGAGVGGVGVPRELEEVGV